MQNTNHHFKLQWTTDAFANAGYKCRLEFASHSVFSKVWFCRHLKIFLYLSKNSYFLFIQKNSVGKSFERLGKKGRGVTCMTSTRTNNVDILYSGSRHGVIYARSFVSVWDSSVEIFFIKLPACPYKKYLRLNKGHRFSLHISPSCVS